jgi:hypothetical protein
LTPRHRLPRRHPRRTAPPLRHQQRQLQLPHHNVIPW